jgi:hypothetical protein
MVNASLLSSSAREHTHTKTQTLSLSLSLSLSHFEVRLHLLYTEENKYVEKGENLAAEKKVNTSLLSSLQVRLHLL